MVCYVEKCADSNPYDLNTDIKSTNTSVEMYCANGVCKINVKCNIAS